MKVPYQKKKILNESSTGGKKKEKKGKEKTGERQITSGSARRVIF